VAGIGCHYMVTWMDRSTATFTHMGGEGVTWVGQAPFTEEKHIFANLGDGTYFHSGLLAIRQSVAAKTNITYKILYNDAVAMTGGQPVDGVLSVPRITRQLEAEGVGRMVIVTDEPEKYAEVTDLAPNVPVRHRDDLDAVHQELRQEPGTTILIYDQTCATEKRRRRKRGKLADVDRRVFINEAVCEGCGDCSVQSNCLSVIPVETEFGRKRAIDQSNCNKDFSCLKGFCPSFVTLEGARLKKGQALSTDEHDWPPLPDPALPSTARPYNLLVTGVGGTGVVTLGALIGMAAHLDGKGVSVLDMTGLAQKYGAVFSHLRFADRPEDIHAARIATGEADAILGGDVVVTAGNEALSKMQEGRTRAVVSCTETPTAEFTRNPDWQFPLGAMQRAIATTVGQGQAWFLDAQALTTRLMGDALYTNMFLLGFAWQQGMVPVSLAALTRAIELNGTTVQANLQALLWGRRVAHDQARVERLTQPPEPPRRHPVDLLEDSIARHRQALSAYQNEALGRHYATRIAALADAERPLDPATPVSLAAARAYYKLLTIKDEYEVARLHTRPEFMAQLRQTFAGEPGQDYQVHFHLAPPLWARPDPATGRTRKREYGPWMLRALKVLAGLRFLRGSALDPFGHTAERRMERQLIADFEADLNLIQQHLAQGNAHPALLALAELPESIRGYGPVKEQAARLAQQKRRGLHGKLQAGSPAVT